LAALQTVKDPEIDSISIIELGMLEGLKITEGKVLIELLPTFMGCPALDIIRKNVCKALLEIERVEDVEVQFINHPPWTSDRVTDIGRERLKEFGIAPPPRHIPETGEWQADCGFQLPFVYMKACNLKERIFIYSFHQRTKKKG